MGYSTDYYGTFRLSKPLTEDQAKYLKKFNETRRMARNESIVETMDDPVRMAVNLPVGAEGEYFVGGIGYMGQDNDNSVMDHNHPPGTQPGLWCQWIPNEAKNGIEWDGGEKFYDAKEWLEYIIENFLKRWGIVMNGSVEWQGEDRDDMGLLMVEDNVVSEKVGRIVYDN